MRPRDVNLLSSSQTPQTLTLHASGLWGRRWETTSQVDAYLGQLDLADHDLGSGFTRRTPGASWPGQRQIVLQNQVCHKHRCWLSGEERR